ncbi:hypothetical protein [Streptomyces akebiae]|uniref:Uncharacterized protein n=1 Tax=Streptomyces akebiae TaxID=2865673 RepID=A0ABX8Y2A5_9ACTN|nr:hypothetical protein [Streptomyces akebiae]QYX82315.1 hypothetical protein K1J60_42380 [Streptomyces akebiae]
MEDVGAGRAVGDHDEERLSSSHWAAIRSIVVSGLRQSRYDFGGSHFTSRRGSMGLDG